MKTKRVRIAVQIAADGEWAAHGSSNPKWNSVECAEYNISTLTDPQTKPIELHWVAADVPIPEGVEDINGEVSA